MAAREGVAMEAAARVEAEKEAATKQGGGGVGRRRRCVGRAEGERGGVGGGRERESVAAAIMAEEASVKAEMMPVAGGRVSAVRVEDNRRRQWRR